MIFSSVTGYRGTAIRLTGLVAVLWSVVVGTHPPALHGRGLVVLIATVLGTIGWLVWTLWSRDRKEVTFDLYLMAASGAVIQMASNSTAGCVLTFVAAVSAAARAGVWWGLLVAAVGAIAVAVAGLIYNDGALAILAYSLGFAASALGGSNIRQYRQRAEQAELLLVQTQRSNEEQLRAKQLEHQTRLARDIHDVLAHSLAGLTIQLEATSALIDAGASSEQIRDRVDRAHELAREGLSETRRAVAALRGEPAERAGSEATAVGDQLEALARGYHDADGEPASYTLEGDPELLHGQLGDTVMRAVQEAITNVRKHAPGAHVSVHVNARPQLVQVAIANHGGSDAKPELAATGGGFGLLGMRERVELSGGSLVAGPVGDGWKVELKVPMAAAEHEASR